MKNRLLLGVLLVAGILAGCSREDVLVENTDDATDISPELIITGSEYNQESAPSEAMKIPFEVNVDWIASVAYGDEGDEWLAIIPKSGRAGQANLMLTADANSTLIPRKAYVSIIYGGQTRRLTVTQEGAVEPAEEGELNLASIFGQQFAQELQRRGYVSSASRITPQDVKGIKSLQMHGGWDASKEVYLGKLTSLNGLEYFESLESLTCWGNQLTSLDVSKNKALEELLCYSNRLTSLDVSGCPELRTLYCRENRLASLDLQHNPMLTLLSCDKNQLTSLDLQHNQMLKRLYCTDNLLVAVDISRNTKMAELSCFNNPGDGMLFPILAWFDNETIPVTEENPDERPQRMLFPTDTWTFEGREIKPDYRKVD